MRFVVVAKFVPWPPNSGDKHRTLGIVRALQAVGDVTVCAFTGPHDDPDGLRAQGIDVQAIAMRRNAFRLVAGLLRGRSITAARFWDRRLERAVAAAVSQGVDLLQVEHVQLVPLARRAAGAHLRVVDMHNVESHLMSRLAGTERGPKRAVLRAESNLLVDVERRAVRFADAVLVASSADLGTLSRVVPGEAPRLVVPNAWDGISPLPQSPDPVVAFVGLMSWAPNVDAAVWFTRMVWPLVRSKVPEARLLLVGRDPAAAVRELAAADVEVTGSVDDLAPFYLRAGCCVAPLLAGGGSRLKILEALAFGRPMVATTIGVEGLEDLIDRGVLVADDPVRMAHHVVTLLTDRSLAASLARRGAEAIRSEHSWAAAVAPVIRLVRQHERRDS